MESLTQNLTEWLPRLLLALVALLILLSLRRLLSRLLVRPVRRFIQNRNASLAAQDTVSNLFGFSTIVADRPQVIDPTVAIYFTDFGDSSLDITIFCDVTFRDWRAYMEEREAINLSVMRIVAGLGLSVAFPTRSVDIEEIPPITGNDE